MSIPVYPKNLISFQIQENRKAVKPARPLLSLGMKTLHNLRPQVLFLPTNPSEPDSGIQAVTLATIGISRLIEA
jgi:predicted subunit of tRNA(5-methylaminomethyl-2-thiouridylate) methyltransferase